MVHPFWLKVRLVGTASNRSAIGAQVWVEALIQGHRVQQIRHIQSAVQSAAGLSGLDAHFGLGDASRIGKLTVEWPSGTKEEFRDLPVKQSLTIVEPSLRGAMQPNGEFALSVWASTHRSCMIEHSPDLVTWTVLTQVQGAGETPVTVTDPDAPDQIQRFYRMK